MVINAETEERMVRGQSEQGGVAKETSDKVALVQPPPLPAGVSGDRQVQMTDDTGLERGQARGAQGVTGGQAREAGRLWGAVRRALRATVRTLGLYFECEGSFYGVLVDYDVAYALKGSL